MTPIQISEKPIEILVSNNFKDNRESQKPKFKIGQLVPAADIKRVFSKGDSPNCSYKLYTIAEVIQHDTIPSLRIEYLPER